jgi:nicotinate-nucleotide adenylyltransferase
MKIGLFFGSFNPVHIGHMAIANYMAEFTDLQQVWFVISPQNPLKLKSSLLGDHHRLQLVRLAIGDSLKYKTSNIEFKMPQPSYTSDTLARLSEKYPQHRFALIMGSDNLQTFHKWKNYEHILSEYPLYVYPRPGSDGGTLASHPQVKQVPAPFMDISATFIRESIKQKKNVEFFMPQEAYEYLREMHFYER